MRKRDKRITLLLASPSSMMHAKHMPTTMRFLLEAHATNMGTSNVGSMRTARTHTFRTFERAFIQMHHRNVTIESIAECKASVTCRASMIPLFQMSDSVVLIGIPPFSECFVTYLASKWF